MNRLVVPGLALLAACGSAPAPVLTPAAQAQADGGKPPYTRADVEFMSGMIGHHAQAVVMAGWAASHDAGTAVQRLAERIVVGQRDEIALMEDWLRDRSEPVPGADSSHAGMPGMLHYAHMPGMLTAQQLAQLDQARGAEFDRLFLTFMIRHHQGAITMVEKLFGSHGAAQDEIVFKFASDVHVDQITEIAFMSEMLAILRAEGKQP
ncbi:MAG TPA: DUF305 domain-containing protein [Gemmatimonadales bacterium]|nr:DUF305 domain-containing protein [Gemmatimonadales bacterium]